VAGATAGAGGENDQLPSWWGLVVTASHTIKIINSQ